MGLEKIEKERIKKFKKFIVKGINDKADEIELFCEDQNQSIEFETPPTMEEHVTLENIQNLLGQLLQKLFSKICTNVKSTDKS